MLEIFIIIPVLFIFHLIDDKSPLMMVRYINANNILIYKDIKYIVKVIIRIIIYHILTFFYQKVRRINFHYK